MESIFNEVCILVAAAFALTLVPGFRNLERSLLSRRDQGAALPVFLILGLIEEATVSHAGWLNERIVAVCAAGLVAGPWVGLAVSVFVTWLAVVHDGLPLGSIATSLSCGGLAGGLLYRWHPKLAQHPLTGFCLTLGVSLLRTGLLFFFAPHSPATLYRIEEIGMAPVLQGLGTALILAIVEQVRDRDDQTRAVALGEVRALQARMNPHFLFNALNTLAALATVAPREAPRAAAEQTIDPGLLKVLMPPFSFQPLVENAIQHGLRSSPQAGRLRLLVRAKGPWLEMSVSDDGQGVPSTEVEHLFFAGRSSVHALVLLRWRLQGLFGRSFQLGGAQ
jgi:two-component system LytT family sensor kinase